MGKKQFKKTPAMDKQNVLFCILCKARIQQVKLHGSKLQTIKNAPRKKSKISAPSAAILSGLRKLAAYHCQVQIFTTYNKVTNMLKFGFIEELFYGNPVKNIKGACQQVIDGDHTFERLYNKQEGEDSAELMLKPLCCGINISAKYNAGVFILPQCISKHICNWYVLLWQVHLADGRFRFNIN